jgi:hypothetical protein
MSADGKKPDPPWLDPQYEQNRAKFPLDELAKYAGQYVAFSLDGTRILASADTMEAVDEKLVAAGIDPSRVVGSYIDEPGISSTGGWFDLAVEEPSEQHL